MKYTVVIEKDEEGLYVAKVPALPGCHTQGETREEAMKNIRKAIALYVRNCRSRGEPIPTEDSFTTEIAV